jgi:16S rRNA (guanine966-N2)-methyltransferase
MRVVAGMAKGRPIAAPEGSGTRPTSDRVREAIFNALFSLDDAVSGARVLDLFAGSGALGIEALSRGAASATFVDRARGAIEVVERNTRHTGVADRSRIVRMEALDWLGRADEQYDLVLCDPPYDFDGWPALLSALERVLVAGTDPGEHAATPGQPGLVVLESDREVDLGEGWQVVRARRYGGTVVSIVRRQSA